MNAETGSGIAAQDGSRFVFTGDIDQKSFADFARHRAERLSLRIRIGAASDQAFEVTAFGAEPLVDMFEMACSLGPYDCIVRDVERHLVPLPYQSKT